MPLRHVLCCAAAAPGRNCCLSFLQLLLRCFKLLLQLRTMHLLLPKALPQIIHSLRQQCAVLALCLQLHLLCIELPLKSLLS
jgi:hypothetical protein